MGKGKQDSKHRHHYLMVSASFVMMMIIWGTFSTFGVFFEPLIKEYGWTRALTSGAASLNNLIFGIACIFTARLCDSFGPRFVITATGFLLGAGYYAMALISSVWQLYLFYGVVIALGMSSYISILTIVARGFVSGRGMMTGIVLSGMGLGIFFMPLAAVRLIVRFQWRTSYMIIALVSFIAMLLAAQFMGRRPARTGKTAESQGGEVGEAPVVDIEGLSFPEASRTGRFWLICFLYFTFLFSNLTILVHIVIHATGLGIPASAAARILAIIGGLCIVGMNAMGIAADRIGNRSALAVSFLFMACALFWLLFAREFWMLYLFAVIFGFAFGGMQTLFSPIVAELFGLRSHGIILSTAALAGTIGAVIGPLLAGYIYDIKSSYDVAVFVCALLCVISVITAPLLKPAGKQGRR
ncbi:MAG: MFS transporter [Pseudomonadota bacterium]